MATTARNSKASIKKRLLDQERARLDKMSDELASLISHVESIDSTTLSAVGALDRLSELGVNPSRVEEATGIPSRRLAALRRQARELHPSDAEVTVEDQEAGTEDVSHSVDGHDVHQEG